jgi:hypothetical protein
VFPYLAIGLALGHEIDHHVNRDNEEVKKEKHAEAKALDYIFPFFLIIKPIKNLVTFLRKKN